MRFFSFPLLSLALLLLLPHCKSSPHHPQQKAQQLILPPLTAPFTKNTLSSASTSFLCSQANSPIHWQTWNPTLLSQALGTKRNFFVFLGSMTTPKSLELLNALSQDTQLTHQLNQSVIPLLIDTNLCPQPFFLLSHLYNNEIYNASHPIILWLTYEGKVISVFHADKSSIENSRHFIEIANRTIHKAYLDSPRYVLEDSKHKLQAGYDALLENFKKNLTSPPLTPSQYRLSIRSIASLYNPYTHTFDETYSLSLARIITLLADASHHPAISSRQQARYKHMVLATIKRNLLGQLYDGIDGGCYNYYSTGSFAIPAPIKTLSFQLDAIEALLAQYSIAPDKETFSAINAIMAFIKQQLSTDSGLYSVGISYSHAAKPTPPLGWKISILQENLPPKQYTLLEKLFGLQSQGNIPLHEDANSRYLNYNLLLGFIPHSQLTDEQRASFRAAQQKLSSMRKQNASLRKEDLALACDNARYISTLLAIYKHTHKENVKDEAITHMKRLLHLFFNGSTPSQRGFFQDSKSAQTLNAYDYALCVKALLDLHQATEDKQWLSLAKKHHQAMWKIFGDKEGFVLNFSQAPPHSFFLKFPCYQRPPFINTPNVWAIVVENASLLSAAFQEDSFLKNVAPLKAIMANKTQEAPLFEVDFLRILSKKPTSNMAIEN